MHDHVNVHVDVHVRVDVVVIGVFFMAAGLVHVLLTLQTKPEARRGAACFALLRTENQNRYFNANCIWRLSSQVEVI